MPLNKAWHAAHRMPKRATLEQRVAWHREHQVACACRPVPATLRQRLAAPAPVRRQAPGKPAAPEKRALDPAFAKVVAALADEPGVSLGGKGFGSKGLKWNGKIFAMQAKGEFVAKLPEGRVAELVAKGEGQAFDSGRGRKMKEWLSASPSNRRWLALAREALSFARGR
jgi:hypothetical protein